MSVMILVMAVVLLGGLVGIGVVGFMLGRRQLPPPSTRSEDRRIIEQAERIELLEDELQRVKDQADFTEKLLEERSREEPRGNLEGHVGD